MFASSSLHAQPCSATLPPVNLVSTYTPGSGVLLEWDAVPGSVAARLRVNLPGGATFNRNIIGTEPDQFFVPEAFLAAGTYTWRVQAACSITPPFVLSPISVQDTFAIPGMAGCPSTVADIDGNVYATVTIGSQCWMVENLKTSRYQNGALIPTGLPEETWSSTSLGAFAFYDNSALSGDVFGALYNWFAVSDARGICPVGWHVPTNAEFTVLTDELGGETLAGGKMKSTGTILAGSGLWASPNIGATNSSGFTALPSGYRDADGIYGDISFYTGFWSSSAASPIAAFTRGLFYIYGDTFTFTDEKRYGYPVRCLKD